MKRYIAQMADEALKAMCGRESLTERVKKAQMQFIFVWDDYHLGSVPEHVRESITAFLKCKTGRGSMRSAALAADAIASSLIEYGRSDAMLSLDLKEKANRSASNERKRRTPR
jgi:hypothetical protein